MRGRSIRIAFHWTTLALLVAAYAIAFYRDGLDDPDQRLMWLDWHRVVGFTLLATTLLRLFTRLLSRVPKTDLPALLHRLSQLSHATLYLGLIAMPLLGWAQSSAKARHFKIFDMPVPALVGHDGDLGERLGSYHETLAWLLLGLIALHSLAALYHHYVLRDDVLRNMLPLKASGGARE